MKFFRLLFVPLALLCVLAIRILWGLGYRIRLGEFYSDRIGHLAGNTECLLCEKDLNRYKFHDIFAHHGKIANKQLAKMIERVVTIDPTGFIRLIMLCNSCIDGYEKYIAQPSQLDRDIFNLFEKYPPHLSFTREEVSEAEAGLIKLGIPPGAKWVCLNVRDSNYLPNLSYHSYRDADIDNYVPAAQWLASKGYYVLRMGAKVSKPMAFTSPKIIDYANHGRSDFMDIYLGARCEFCITTGSGFDSIPYIFRRPLVYTDYVPFEYFFTFVPKSLAIWKHHEKDGKRMSVAEIAESKAGLFMKSQQFEDEGIKLIDNTPEEILSVVKEMVEGSSGDQSWFWAQYPRNNTEGNNVPLHGEIKMRIGSEFLKGYRDEQR